MYAQDLLPAILRKLGNAGALLAVAVLAFFRNRSENTGLLAGWKYIAAS
jgi:hypothetical protein